MCRVGGARNTAHSRAMQKNMATMWGPIPMSLSVVVAACRGAACLVVVGRDVSGHDAAQGPQEGAAAAKHRFGTVREGRSNIRLAYDRELLSARQSTCAGNARGPRTVLSMRAR